MTDFLLFIFIISFFIQSFYFLVIFSRLIFYREKDKSEEVRGVSVVIAARNERNNLEKLIPLLLAQNHSDFEIIIASDRSSDGSLEFISSFKDKNLKVINITETPKDFNPKKYALTQAIEIAEKEIILLTDADCYPGSKNWIREMQAGFSEGKEVVLGYSPYEKKKGALNLFIRYEAFYTAVQYLSFAVINQAYMGVGRNLAYLRHLFLQNKGFNQHKSVTGGDDDLFIGQIAGKNNVTIKISPDSKIISVPKENYRDFFIQKTRHLSAGQRYKWNNKVKTGLLPISQVLLYFSIIILLFSNTYISLILGIFILRTLVLIIIFALISRKLGETIKWLWFPVLDLSYLFNYIIIGVSVVFSKNIKWT